MDIILAVATNYKDIRNYDVFIKTLRKTGCKLPLYLGITKGIEYQHVENFLLEHSINFFYIPDIKPGKKIVNGYRFKCMGNYIKKLNYRYALVMDFRDAYFQVDPTKYIKSYIGDNDLYLMSEFRYLNFRNQNNQMNWWWVAAPFGKDVIQQFENKPILNSGAILGKKKAIEYLFDLIGEICEKQNYDYADQGTLNYVYYTNKLKHLKVKVEEAGISIVNNGGFTELEDLKNLSKKQINELIEKISKFEYYPLIKRNNKIYLDLFVDNEGYVLNNNKKRSIVVHQHDRYVKQLYFARQLCNKYESKNSVYIYNLNNSNNYIYQGEKYTILTTNNDYAKDLVKYFNGNLESLNNSELEVLSFREGNIIKLPKDINIINAKYGISGNFQNISQEYIKNNIEINNVTMNGDPVPGKSKILNINYTKNKTYYNWDILKKEYNSYTTRILLKHNFNTNDFCLITYGCIHYDILLNNLNINKHNYKSIISKLNYVIPTFTNLNTQLINDVILQPHISQTLT
jgi:hypothetical protein